MNLGSMRLLVQDFAGSFRFYRDVMGFRPTWGDATSSYASFDVGGPVVLAIFLRDQQAEAVGAGHLPSQVPQQDRVLLSFTVDDLEATVTELTAKGAKFVTEPKAYPDWTIRAAYLRDPDGNLIEISSGLAKSEWTDRVKEEARKDGCAKNGS
jgi:lactoylglutathione lyase